MFCAQDSGIARGQTLRVATKKCMAWSCFSIKSSVFGQRMPHFAVILCDKFIDKYSLREVEGENLCLLNLHSDLHECLEIYSANLGIHVRGLAHLSV